MHEIVLSMLCPYEKGAEGKLLLGRYSLKLDRSCRGHVTVRSKKYVIHNFDVYGRSVDCNILFSAFSSMLLAIKAQNKLKLL